MLAIDDLHVGEPRDLAGLEPSARQRGAPSAVERLGVGKIDGAVLCEIVVEDDVQQPALADGKHFRHVRKRRRELAIRCDDAHAAGALGHQHAAVGKESKRPGVRQALRDGMDRERMLDMDKRIQPLGKVGSAACTVLLVARTTPNATIDRMPASFDAASTVRHRPKFRNTRFSYGSFCAWGAAVKGRSGHPFR